MGMRISVKNIVFSYTRRMEDAVFRDVGFSVQSGEVFCLLGPNGTGKSTLLKCLMNILRPQQGIIELDGKELSTMGVSRVAKKVARRSSAAAIRPAQFYHYDGHASPRYGLGWVGRWGMSPRGARRSGPFVG